MTHCLTHMIWSIPHQSWGTETVSFKTGVGDTCFYCPLISACTLWLNEWVLLPSLAEVMQTRGELVKEHSCIDIIVAQWIVNLTGKFMKCIKIITAIWLLSSSPVLTTSRPIVNISPNSFPWVTLWKKNNLCTIYEAWLEHCEQTLPCRNIWTITNTNAEI